MQSLLIEVDGRASCGSTRPGCCGSADPSRPTWCSRPARSRGSTPSCGPSRTAGCWSTRAASTAPTSTVAGSPSTGSPARSPSSAGPSATSTLVITPEVQAAPDLVAPSAPPAAAPPPYVPPAAAVAAPAAPPIPPPSTPPAGRASARPALARRRLRRDPHPRCPALPGPAGRPARTGPDLLVVAEGREFRFRHPAHVTARSAARVRRRRHRSGLLADARPGHAPCRAAGSYRNTSQRGHLRQGPPDRADRVRRAARSCGSATPSPGPRWSWCRSSRRPRRSDGSRASAATDAARARRCGGRGPGADRRQRSRSGRRAQRRRRRWRQRHGGRRRPRADSLDDAHR